MPTNDNGNAHKFPRLGPHVSWQQRWYNGSGNKQVLRPREKPVALKELDYEGAEQRIELFRKAVNRG